MRIAPPIVIDEAARKELERLSRKRSMDGWPTLLISLTSYHNFGCPTLRRFCEGWVSQISLRVVPSPRRPMGFDLDRADFSGEVMTEAGPRPILRSGGKSAPDGIAVHVLEFFDCLLMRPDVEIVVPSLPESRLSPPLEPSRSLLLQNLNGEGKQCFPRLTRTQMNVLGHNYIAGHDEPVALPHIFQFLLEDEVSDSILQ